MMIVPKPAASCAHVVSLKRLVTHHPVWLAIIIKASHGVEGTHGVVVKATRIVEGTHGVVVHCKRSPHRLAVASCFSPGVHQKKENGKKDNEHINFRPPLERKKEHTRAEASRGPLHSVGTGARVRSYPTIP
jgi:hypothetical protein